MDNLEDLENAGSFYTMMLKPCHRKFYDLSYSIISTEVAKLHKNNDTTNFPHVVANNLKPLREFTDGDRAHVHGLQRVIQGIIGRKAKSKAKLANVVSSRHTTPTTYHFRQATPTIGSEDLKKYPQLYMLYRHGSDWLQREGLEKKKAIALFADTYAFTMFSAWLCYADTCGRMLANCPEYITIREKLFDFLSPHVQPSLIDILGKSRSSNRTLGTRFLNWDHRIVDVIKAAADELPEDAQMVKRYEGETPKEFLKRSNRVNALMRSLKRTADGILKNPLVHGPTKEDYSSTFKMKEDPKLTQPMLVHLRGLLLVGDILFHITVPY